MRRSTRRAFGYALPPPQLQIAAVDSGAVSVAVAVEIAAAAEQDAAQTVDLQVLLPAKAAVSAGAVAAVVDEVAAAEQSADSCQDGELATYL